MIWDAEIWNLILYGLAEHETISIHSLENVWTCHEINGFYLHISYYIYNIHMDQFQGKSWQMCRETMVGSHQMALVPRFSHAMDLSRVAGKALARAVRVSTWYMAWSLSQAPLGNLQMRQKQGDFHGGIPKSMVYNGKSPSKVDDLGVPPFQDTPKC